IAQLLIVSELEISKEQAPESAMKFEDVAILVEPAQGQVCERCRRTDITVGRHSHEHLSAFCQPCSAIIEKDFPQVVAEGFE
ncbi:MAG: hypothetical protein FWE43_01935, partial [Streptococcaceae bacterium]|nr:hypothetical protein [Streptococcaceae bacterium]